MQSAQMAYRDVKRKEYGQYDIDIAPAAQAQRFEQRPPPKKRKVEEYRHYAAVAIDDDGHCLMLSSPSLRRHKRTILTHAMAQLREILVEVQNMGKVSKTKPLHHPPHGIASAPHQIRNGSLSFASRTKRPRLHSNDRDRQPDYEVYSNHSDDSSSQEVIQARNTNPKKEVTIPSNILEIHAGETEKWRAWFSDGFTLIQQTACRTIAKEWIKAIHPKKQSTHPYNGKVPRIMGDSADPERTRPPYWPPGVRHKEPDHIDKTARTRLLVHLLMHTPQEEIVPDKTKSEKSFCAKDLLAALQKKQDDGIIAKWPVLQELIQIRDILENYEEGGMDADATITVPDWGEILHAAGSKKKNQGQLAQASEGDSEIGTNKEIDDTASEVTDEPRPDHEGPEPELVTMAERNSTHEIFQQPPTRCTDNEQTVKLESRLNMAPGSHSQAQKGSLSGFDPSRDLFSHRPSFEHVGMNLGHKGNGPDAPGFRVEHWHQVRPGAHHPMVDNYNNMMAFEDPLTMGQTFPVGHMHQFMPTLPMQNMPTTTTYLQNPNYLFTHDRPMSNDYGYNDLNNVDRAGFPNAYDQVQNMYHN